jgi:hypothetical protein
MSAMDVMDGVRVFHDGAAAATAARANDNVVIFKFMGISFGCRLFFVI